jgi:hypothetical protein
MGDLGYGVRVRECVCFHQFVEQLQALCGHIACLHKTALGMHHLIFCTSRVMSLLEILSNSSPRIPTNGWTICTLPLITVPKEEISLFDPFRLRVTFPTSTAGCCMHPLPQQLETQRVREYWELECQNQSSMILK